MAIIGLPISAISLLIAWFYMIRFGSKISSIKSDIFEKRDVIAEKLGELGSMCRDEKIVALVFFMTAAAWISNGVFWKDIIPTIDDSMIAIASAILLFIIPSTLKAQNSKKNDLRGFLNITKSRDKDEVDTKKVQNNDRNCHNFA
jgi:solute carrier family 13 (sodium-dependent dicarboxylate transporter), member 2/3/5